MILFSDFEISAFDVCRRFVVGLWGLECGNIFQLIDWYLRKQYIAIKGFF